VKYQQAQSTKALPEEEKKILHTQLGPLRGSSSHFLVL